MSAWFIMSRAASRQGSRGMVSGFDPSPDTGSLPVAGAISPGVPAAVIVAAVLVLVAIAERDVLVDREAVGADVEHLGGIVELLVLVRGRHVRILLRAAAS